MLRLPPDVLRRGVPEYGDHWLLDIGCGGAQYGGEPRGEAVGRRPQPQAGHRHLRPDAPAHRLRITHQRRRPQVVLEHDERPVGAAYDVRAGDPQRHRRRRDVGFPVDAGIDELPGQHPRPDRLRRVAQERLQSPDSLPQPGREPVPLRAADHPRHRVDMQQHGGARRNVHDPLAGDCAGDGVDQPVQVRAGERGHHGAGRRPGRLVDRPVDDRATDRRQRDAGHAAALARRACASAARATNRACSGSVTSKPKGALASSAR